MTAPTNDPYKAHNDNIIAEFRGNAGVVGGRYEGVPLVLVHHVGAKSGAERISPLAYRAEGDRIFVFGSKNGGPTHPAWYYNLVANPAVTVEIGTETFQATARELTGTERDEVYARQATQHPVFDAYQHKTTRTIPVIELSRT
jgi:deazaflavin-dependent oxidoreductase (nitroreductase family)